MHRGIFYRRRTHLIVDIQGEILQIHRMGLLDLLLTDKTAEAAAKKAGGPARKHILWATDVYQALGPEYRRSREIAPALITGERSGVIRTRARKALEQQNERTRTRAEVFTPLTIVRRMVSAADAVWFGRQHDRFDEERIPFTKEKTWKRYVDARRLEITCGEAPYLATRYDAATGEGLPLACRTGLLDRKLRAVSENAEGEEEWLRWAFRALEATYGYEFSGDNVLIARVNLFMTFKEYLHARWQRNPTGREAQHAANIIAWNLWQMDGLTGAVPYCRDDAWREANLFEPDEPEPLLEETPLQPRCRIYDWRRKNSLDYMDINTGGRNMKFDFIIGNPPYQEETDSDSTRKPPIYHLFMDEAFKLSKKVELITPARFLFNAGYTPKHWNEKMLNDQHFKILEYEPDSNKIFPNIEIKGGVVISYWDENAKFASIGTFTKYYELNSILRKVKQVESHYLDEIISSPLNYTLTNRMKKEHPDLLDRLRTSAFSTLSSIFYETKPNDGLEYIALIGLLNGKRTERFIRKDYIKDGNDILNKFNVLLPKAIGTGKFGERLASELIALPGVGYTQTFIAIGAFNTNIESKNAIKYIKTKFARAMLGILKITQDCPAPKWKYVPLQDFTDASDINWSQSVVDIDRQLYAKYGLDEKEIDFIESHVKEMK